MTTDYLVEIKSWDRALHLLPSPGGIPEEHTFQGDMIFVRSIQFEGRVLEPSADRGKLFRGWVFKLWEPDSADEPITDVGSIEERGGVDSSELLANLYVPERALEPATICFASCWRYLRLKACKSPGEQASRVGSLRFGRTAHLPHI